MKVKSFIKIITFYLKSSTLLINTVTHIYKTFLQKERCAEKGKKLIFEFLEKSYERHKKFLK